MRLLGGPSWRTCSRCRCRWTAELVSSWLRRPLSSAGHALRRCHLTSPSWPPTGMHLATLLQPQGRGGEWGCVPTTLETQLGERMVKMTPARVRECRVAATLWRSDTRLQHGIVHSGFQSAFASRPWRSKLYEKDRPVSKDKNGTSYHARETILRSVPSVASGAMRSHSSPPPSCRALGVAYGGGVDLTYNVSLLDKAKYSRQAVWLSDSNCNLYIGCFWSHIYNT